MPGLVLCSADRAKGDGPVMAGGGKHPDQLNLKSSGWQDLFDLHH
jgi:hypothetical protein